jgi:hypothetical protein
MTIRRPFFGALAVLLLLPVLFLALTPTSAWASSPGPGPGTITGPVPTNFWLATSAGDVYPMGGAADLGSLAGVPLARPIVGITPTPSDDGYWLVASDGGIFTFGDAGFYGSTGGVHLNQPIIGMASTPDGGGYWLFASDGGVFTFGDAAFYGSTGAVHLDKPIIGMTPTPDGRGYWLIASDGGVFTFGDAAFYGSMGSAPSSEPTESVISSRSGHGYWIVDQNGTVNPFGDASGAPPTMGLMFRPATEGDAAVLFAFAQLGKPYIWGGNGPVGYDCSGLALASWEHADNVSFARVSDDQYQTAGTPVALSDLIAGDLVFWGTSQTVGSSVYHTAIYVGGGRIVEATGDVVQLNSLGQWGQSDLMPNGRRP